MGTYPGQVAGEPLERKMLRMKVDVEHVSDVLCSADIHVLDARVGCEKASSECWLPSPYVELEGRVVKLRGSMPHGVHGLSYADSDVSEGGRCPGPHVRIRYDFTPLQKARLEFDKGAMEPDWAMQDVLHDCMLEGVPLLCHFSTVTPPAIDGWVCPHCNKVRVSPTCVECSAPRPDDAKTERIEVPFTFASIDNAFDVRLTQADSGYDLVDYFEDSKIMKQFADMVMPHAQAEEAERLVRERFEDDLLAAYELDDDDAVASEPELDEPAQDLEEEAGQDGSIRHTLAGHQRAEIDIDAKIAAKIAKVLESGEGQLDVAKIAEEIEAQQKQDVEADADLDRMHRRAATFEREHVDGSLGEQEQRDMVAESDLTGDDVLVDVEEESYAKDYVSSGLDIE